MVITLKNKVLFVTFPVLFMVELQIFLNVADYVCGGDGLWPK